MHDIVPSSLVLGLVLFAAACGPREPGPLEHERGRVTYWASGASSLTYDGCSDASAFRSDIGLVAPEEGSYLMYVVSEDGTQAVAQTCTTTLASSCSDSPTGIVFEVSGHTLTYDPAAELFDIENSVCDLEMDQLWTFEDRGETGSMEIDMALALVGDPATCAALEAQLESQSPNGLGYDGCTVTLTVDQEFYQSTSG